MLEDVRNRRPTRAYSGRGPLRRRVPSALPFRIAGHAAEAQGRWAFRMCQHVYIASDAELPHVAWLEDDPAFHTSTLDEAERRVAIQFTKPHILYLGASTGCSCGFRGPSKDVSVEQVERNVASLIAYVSAAVHHSSIELFTCWDGDELSKPEERLTLAPEELRETGEWFREGVFVVFGRNA